MSFGGLARRSLGELLVFNGVISLTVTAVLWVMGRFAHFMLASKGTAFTTANAKDVLLSWQGAFLIATSIVMVALYIALDLFAHIYFCKSLLDGETDRFPVRAARAIKEALGALGRFASPSGLPTLLYIVVLAPLVGVGFSIGLTRDFYVPHFIMGVVESTPAYAIAYEALILMMLVIGILHLFTIHGVLLDGLSPTEARRRSRHMMRTDTRSLLKSALKAVLVAAGVFLTLLLILMVPYALLRVAGGGMPAGQPGIMTLLQQGVEPTDEAVATTLFRTLCFLFDIVAAGSMGIAALLTGSCAMLYITHLYEWHGKEQAEEPTYIISTGRTHRWRLLLGASVTLVLVAVMSFLMSLVYEAVMAQDKPAAVIAHRLGGNTAPENSLQGLECAVESGCYGAETDIQRTRDGHYIINHDDTFERLTGNTAAPQDMTLEEIGQLRLHDPRFPDVETEVPTLEETLDASKGRIKLFVELKGKTADHQMVDDAVRIVRERDAVDDVVLISLNYDCISYAKETYPEFECGLLFFAQYGDVSLLKCDILLAEEEMTTDSFVIRAHDAGKEVGVWTVDTEDDLRRTLRGQADYIITDEIALAHDMQEWLDSRTELEAITELIWHPR